MKLVDILARELKEWPDQYDSIIQDEGGHLHGCYSLAGDDTDQGGLPFDPAPVAWDGSHAIITHAEWQAAVNALKAKKEFVAFDFSGPVLDYGPKEWTGEGLPPVGTVCEMQNAIGIWREVEIFAHFKGNVFGWDGGELINYFSNDPHEFRPIRTPEQIAAEERETELNRMVATVSMLDKGWARKVCAGLYDAGYRKFEIVE